MTLKNTPKLRGNRLKRIRNLANLSRKKLCEGTGNELNPNTLKGWELGRHGGLSIKGAENIVQRLQEEGVSCTLDWLLHEIGQGPTIVSNYAKTKELKAVNSLKKPLLWAHEEEQIAQEMSLFRSFYSHTLDVIVNDDGMLPFYQIGDYLAGIPQYKENIAHLIEEHCIVLTAKGELFLRKIRQGSAGDLFNLTCINTETSVKEPILYDVELIAAAPVLWQRRKNNK
jgi:transcriptional regulator with XRE-family HTH domain